MAEWLIAVISGAIGVVGTLLTLAVTVGPKFIEMRKQLGQVRLAEEAERIKLEAEDRTHDENYLTRQLARSETEITRLNQRLTAYEAHTDAMQKRMEVLHEAHLKCLANEEMSKAKFIVMEGQIAQLQKIATAASVPVTTTVMGDIHTGLIVDTEDNVKDVLGWRREELIGKPIDSIIPRDIQHRHHKGIERSRVSGMVRSPDVAIQSYAQTRSGDRIPVIVSLSSYTDPDGKPLVAAQIVHRKVFSVVDVITGSHEHVPLAADRRVMTDPEYPGPERREERKPPADPGPPVS